jgi:tetracycline resistance efflux pump
MLHSENSICFTKGFRMDMSWVVIVPPLIVILLAAITKRILFALSVGVISASLIVTAWNVPDAFTYAAKRVLMTTQLQQITSVESFLSCSNLFVMLFLLLLGVLISMIGHSGAAYAYGAFVMRKIKTARGAQCASLMLSHCFFIDDYFSGITIGSVMQPITDCFKVPRVKLALLVSSLAAPLAILVPLSTWVADLLGQLRNSGVGFDSQDVIIACDPYSFYLSAIPFMMYAIIVVASLWYMVLTGLSYGVVARHERKAQATDDLFGGKIAVAHRSAQVSEALKQSSSIVDFILPIVVLFSLTILLVLWTGNAWMVGGDNGLIATLQQARMFFSLFAGGLGAVVTTMVYYVIRKRIALRRLPQVVGEGAMLMAGSLGMLLFIWTLSGIIRDDLNTGAYLADLLIGQVRIAFFPLMFFALTAFISTLMGTAWGAIGILVPLAFSMVPAFLGLPLPLDIVQVPLLSALLGAIVCGAIVGNHMSPIADVLVMSATSAGAYHLDVVKSQIQLTVPTVFASLLAYYVVGLTLDSYGGGASAALGVCSGLLANFVLLHLLQWIDRKRNEK